MVNVETDLPAPGDSVRVAWGLGSVEGHVLESYAGTRPRVVVEIDPHELGDEAVSVAVPLGAVEPLDGSTSPWAQRARYEIAIADALRRVLGSKLEQVRLNSVVADTEVDLVAMLADKTELIIQVKTGLRNRSMLHRLISQTSRLALSRQAHALIIVSQPPVIDSPPGPVPVVSWQGQDDDHQLRAAIEKLLAIN